MSTTSRDVLNIKTSDLSWSHDFVLSTSWDVLNVESSASAKQLMHSETTKSTNASTRPVLPRSRQTTIPRDVNVKKAYDFQSCIFIKFRIQPGHFSKKTALIPDVSRSSTSPGMSPTTFTTDPPQHCWVVPHLYPVTFWTQNSVLVHLVSAQNQKTSAFAKDLSKSFREPFTVKHQSPAQWMMLFLFAL